MPNPVVNSAFYLAQPTENDNHLNELLILWLQNEMTTHKQWIMTTQKIHVESGKGRKLTIAIKNYG